MSFQVTLSDLALYSMRQTSRGLSATAELLGSYVLAFDTPVRGVSVGVLP